MKIEVVYGAPCSGKSTYVQDRLTDNDITYDYDRLIRAMTNRKEQLADTSVAHSLAIQMRYTIISWLQKNRDTVATAYIITRYPTDELKEKLTIFDDVEYVPMQTSLKECLARLEGDDMRPDKDAWEEIIQTWYDQHGESTKTPNKNSNNARSRAGRRGFYMPKKTRENRRKEGGMERLEKTKRFSVAKADAATDIELINQFAIKELTPEDVFCFSVVLCDNDIDREVERFTDRTLEQLAELFVGKTGISDHVWSADRQIARVYWTSVEKTDRKTALDTPLKQLRAKAYMVRNDTNKAIIDSIEAGIIKEVSIGCAVKNCNCSICGKKLGFDWRTWTYQCETGHIKGETYPEGLCFGNLENPIDAYEFSFVAVPAQRGAGVTKGMNAPDEAFEILMTADLSGCGAQIKALIPRLQSALADEKERVERAKILQENQKFLKAKTRKDDVTNGNDTL